MLDSLIKGVDIIEDALRIFRKHPRLLLPLLACWCLYAPVLVYFTFFFELERCPILHQGLFGFLVTCFFAFIVAVSFLVLLELIQQLEAGQKLSVFRSLLDALRRDLLKSMPIILFWACAWFLLMLIEAAVSKAGKRAARKGFSAENAARVLAGYDDVSLSEALFLALQKGIRMVVFLMLPAIAWEGKGPLAAIKRGSAVLKAHLAQLASGYVLTGLAAAFVYFPASLVFFVADHWQLDLPDPCWYIVIIYLAFAWSFSLFLEQLFMAELYMWHLRWERECEYERSRGRHAPTLTEVRPPLLLWGTL